MKLKELPTTVAILCSEYDGWVVGSAAAPLSIKNNLYGIDVIVPFHQWRKVSKIVAAKEGALLNKHGGTRFQEAGIQIDVWPDTICENMLTCITHWLWQPRYDIRFERVLK